MSKYTITFTYGWLGLLGILFIILRILEVIEWPWIWVLAPLWMPIAVCLIFFILIAIVLVSNKNKRLPE